MTFAEQMNWIEREHKFPEDPALFNNKRFARLLSESGLRERLAAIPGIVGAGSCGKASTLSFTARIFSALGLRCAVGVKPPLNESPLGNLERYQLWEGAEGGRRMTPAELSELFPPLREAVLRMEAERPELGGAAPYDMRALLLEAFAVSQRADLLVSEANIGRRRDPISCLPDTVLTLITPIGTDHGGLLTAPEGFHPELGAKAGPFFDKADGLRLGKAAVFGRQDGDIGALLDPRSVIYGRDYTAVDCASSLSGTSFRLRLSADLSRYLDIDAETLESRIFKLQALGRFQCENAAQALTASLVLRRRARLLTESSDDPLRPYRDSRLYKALLGYSLDEFLEAASSGLKAACVPGRLQLLEPDCISAVASSPEKLGALLQSLSELGGGRRFCVCATFLDRIHYLKEAVELLAAWPENEFTIITKFLNDEVNRDIDPGSAAVYCPNAAVCPDPEAACEMVKERARRSGSMVLFLGNGMLSCLNQP